jgi:hypothetical protein
MNKQNKIKILEHEINIQRQKGKYPYKLFEQIERLKVK